MPARRAPLSGAGPGQDLNEATALSSSVLLRPTQRYEAQDSVEKGITMQHKLLLAYTRWLAKHQRLTFPPERLVEAYIATVKSDADRPAA